MTTRPRTAKQAENDWQAYRRDHRPARDHRRRGRRERRERRMARRRERYERRTAKHHQRQQARQERRDQRQQARQERRDRQERTRREQREAYARWARRQASSRLPPDMEARRRAREWRAVPSPQRQRQRLERQARLPEDAARRVRAYREQRAEARRLPQQRGRGLPEPFAGCVAWVYEIRADRPDGGPPLLYIGVTGQGARRRFAQHLGWDDRYSGNTNIRDAYESWGGRGNPDALAHVRIMTVWGYDSVEDAYAAERSIYDAARREGRWELANKVRPTGRPGPMASGWQQQE